MDPSSSWEMDSDSWEVSQEEDSYILQRPCNSSHLQSKTKTYKIPGPAGVIQAAKLRKRSDNQVENPKPTQEYIREMVENPGDDDEFKRGPWLSAMEFAYPDGGNSTLGNIKDCLENGKLDKAVAVIKSCVPNAVGDLTCMLKDTTGTVSGTIHHKVLTEVKGICVGSVLVLHKVSVFTPHCYSSSPVALNITMKNLVKVFYKDGGSS